MFFSDGRCVENLNKQVDGVVRGWGWAFFRGGGDQYFSFEVCELQDQFVGRVRLRSGGEWVQEWLEVFKYFYGCFYSFVFVFRGNLLFGSILSYFWQRGIFFQGVEGWVRQRRFLGSLIFVGFIGQGCSLFSRLGGRLGCFVLVFFQFLLRFLFYSYFSFRSCYVFCFFRFWIFFI